MYYNYDYIRYTWICFDHQNLVVISFSSNPYNENDSFKLLQVIT